MAVGWRMKSIILKIPPRVPQRITSTRPGRKLLGRITELSLASNLEYPEITVLSKGKIGTIGAIFAISKKLKRKKNKKAKEQVMVSLYFHAQNQQTHRRHF